MAQVRELTGANEELRRQRDDYRQRFAGAVQETELLRGQLAEQRQYFEFRLSEVESTRDTALMAMVAESKELQARIDVLGTEKQDLALQFDSLQQQMAQLSAPPATTEDVLRAPPTMKFVPAMERAIGTPPTPSTQPSRCGDSPEAESRTCSHDDGEASSSPSEREEQVRSLLSEREELRDAVATKEGQIVLMECQVEITQRKLKLADLETEMLKRELEALKVATGASQAMAQAD